MICFLSYSSADFKIAEALYRFLTQAGEDVFFAPRSDNPQMFAAISDALQSSTRFIYLNSRDYMASQYCRFEWSGFVGRYGSSPEDLDIIGVMLDDTNP